MAKRNESRRTGNLYSSLGNRGRFSGTGISYDDYGEESGFSGYSIDRSGCRLPNERMKDMNSLNGECIIVQPARKEKVDE